MAVAGAGAGTEPNLWSKLEPEPKINNFGSATLVYYPYKILVQFFFTETSVHKRFFIVYRYEQ